MWLSWDILSSRSRLNFSWNKRWATSDQLIALLELKYTLYQEEDNPQAKQKWYRQCLHNASATNVNLSPLLSLGAQRSLLVMIWRCLIFVCLAYHTSACWGFLCTLIKKLAPKLPTVWVHSLIHICIKPQKASVEPDFTTPLGSNHQVLIAPEPPHEVTLDAGIQGMLALRQGLTQGATGPCWTFMTAEWLLVKCLMYTILLWWLHCVLHHTIGMDMDSITGQWYELPLC